LTEIQYLSGNCLNLARTFTVRTICSTFPIEYLSAIARFDKTTMTTSESKLKSKQMSQRHWELIFSQKRADQTFLREAKDLSP
jgi:ribosomal protein RSM22 (predicted rRNA methylase)